MELKNQDQLRGESPSEHHNSILEGQFAAYELSQLFARFVVF
jgi:hypothetical protein